MPETLRAPMVIPIRPASPPQPDGYYTADFVVPEPGRWQYRMVWYAEKPADPNAVYYEPTGSWLTSELVNLTTDEVRGVSRLPELYQACSG